MGPGTNYFSTHGTSRGSKLAFTFARGLPSNIAMSVKMSLRRRDRLFASLIRSTHARVAP